MKSRAKIRSPVAGLFPPGDHPTTTGRRRARAARPRRRRPGRGADRAGTRGAWPRTTPPYVGVRARWPGRAEPARARRTAARWPRSSSGRPPALRVTAARAGVVWPPSRSTHGPSQVPLQLPSPRYVAMQRHFDSVGPAGRRMMRADRLDPGVPGLVARAGRARAVAGAAPRRAVPGGGVRAERRPGVAAGDLAGRSTRPGPPSTTGCCAATTRSRRTPTSPPAPRSFVDADAPST